MRAFYKSLTLILFISIIWSCKKNDPKPNPLACFTLSSTTIQVGESVTTTNCSSNADSYLWIGSQASTSLNPTFTYNYTGTYNIQLSATGNGTTSTASQTLTVIPAAGSVTFWESGSTTHYITTVTINGVSKQITQTYSGGITDCGQAGCASFDLPVGTYSFNATDGSSTWSGTINIGQRSCVKQQLL